MDEELIIIHRKDGQCGEATVLSLTPEQAVALERIAWALWPKAGTSGSRNAAVAAIAVAIEQPGPFITISKERKLTLDKIKNL